MNKSNSEYKIQDDIDLLNLIIKDSTDPREHYNPGPYWKDKTKTALKDLKKFGLENFRGSENMIGMSFADNVILDATLAYTGFKKIIANFIKIFPLKYIFQSQIRITRQMFENYLISTRDYFNGSDRVKYLLSKYKIPFSILGNCIAKVKINNEEIAIHYLNLLEQHDNVSKSINFKSIKSVFEIGGGFGCNVHLLLSNYPNIKKVIYLDIAPNLYVGTQYLKSFYGESVIDYSKSKDLKEIKFKNNEQLEIYCILPAQIEILNTEIDFFTNSHSFVEMPSFIVKNYIQKLQGLPSANKTKIAIISYDSFDLNSTLHPDSVSELFEKVKFSKRIEKYLLDNLRNNYYYISD